MTLSRYSIAPWRWSFLLLHCVFVLLVFFYVTKYLLVHLYIFTPQSWIACWIRFWQELLGLYSGVLYEFLVCTYQFSVLVYFCQLWPSYYLCLLLLLLSYFIVAGSTCHITSYTFPHSVYFQTVQHTHINKGKSSQFWYNLFDFENPTHTQLDTLLFITELIIYAATSPLN